MVVMQMSVTRKSIILAIIFGILCSSLYIYSLKFDDTQEISIKGLPTFIATDSFGTSFNENGEISKTMTAKKTVYYDESLLYFFDDPLITSYKKEKDNSTSIWCIKGNKGKMVAEDNAIFNGDVLVYPKFNDPVIDKAVADNLVYNFKNNTISSLEEVTIYGHEFTTKGTHFNFNIDTNVLTYKGLPHATFYPAKK